MTKPIRILFEAYEGDAEKFDAIVEVLEKAASN